VIQAYAQDLAERLQEEGATALEAQGDLAAYLQQLQVQVQRCKGITTNLLDFARRGPTEPEPVDAGMVARATAALVGARARKASVTVQVDLPAGMPPVRAPRDQLQQIFLNLVTNALDATEEAGGGTITITGGVDGGFVRLGVTDTGAGMDQATLARAMEPFFTTKPPGRGTGLGLSTCYGIVTGLGGQMAIASEPGKGTTVTFTLPVWGEQNA
jgi:two-component system NtrC family sensor kinase